VYENYNNNNNNIIIRFYTNNNNNNNIRPDAVSHGTNGHAEVVVSTVKGSLRRRGLWRTCGNNNKTTRRRRQRRWYEFFFFVKFIFFSSPRAGLLHNNDIYYFFFLYRRDFCLTTFETIIIFYDRCPLTRHIIPITIIRPILSFLRRISRAVYCHTTIYDSNVYIPYTDQTTVYYAKYVYTRI